MGRLKRHFPWIVGALLGVAPFFCARLLTYMRFEIVDDALIQRILMGFEGGAPGGFNLYVGTPLMAALGGIATLLPGKPVWALWQLFCLWLALAAVGKSVVQCATNRGKSLVCSAALAAVCVLLIGIYPFARVQYTTTSGLLGAAALAQLCAMEAEKRHPLLGTAFSLFLLALTYEMRSSTLLPLLPLWLLCLGYVALQRKRGGLPKRAFARGLCLGGAVLLLCVGVRGVERVLPENREYFAFQEARTQLLDYHWDDVSSIDDQALATVGWSRAELEMVKSGYYLDENISAETLNTLLGGLPGKSAGERLLGAAPTVWGLIAANWRYLAVAFICLLCCLYCLAAKEGELLPFLCALAALCGGAVMLLYLAYAGRIPLRAVNCILYPVCALLCCLAARGLGRPAGKRAAALTLCALALFAMGYMNIRWILRDVPQVYYATLETDLEAFARDNPETLIVHDPHLIVETRLAPDVSAGVPANILPWGDWCSRTPNWYRQLEKFGFDGRRFTARDFLKEHLVFATAENQMLTTVTDYLSHQLGRPVAAELTATSGQIELYRFR